MSGKRIIFSIFIIIALSLLTYGAIFSKHWVYEKTFASLEEIWNDAGGFEEYAVPPVEVTFSERMSEFQMVENSTFSGVRRAEDGLLYKVDYEGPQPGGRRACPG
jgi:hypothetical protein